MQFRVLASLCAISTLVMASPAPAQLPFVPTESADSLTAQYASSAQPHPRHADPPVHRPLSLADLLTSSRQASIAYDYIRDSPAIAALLIAPKPHYTTLLIPTNSAIMALARKPHQGPAPVVGGEIRDLGGEGEKEHEELCRAYLERWVKLHVVPGRVGEEKKEGKEYDTMVEGRKVSFVRAIDGPGAVLVMPGRIAVTGVAEVCGLVWIRTTRELI